MVLAGGAQADPRGRNASDRLSSMRRMGCRQVLCGLQGGDDHDDSGRDSRRHCVLGPAYQRHGDGTDADQDISSEACGPWWPRLSLS
jgi:hypothetical protein